MPPPPPHCSIVLLPLQPEAAGDERPVPSSSSGSRAGSSRTRSMPPPSAAAPMPHPVALDWGNCCVFQLLPGRGPVVQPSPPWPVVCTSAHHAALAARDVLVVQRYGPQGPHFLDWKSLSERGCVSMAAVPLLTRGQPAAVLVLGSQQVRSAALCWQKDRQAGRQAGAGQSSYRHGILSSKHVHLHDEREYTASSKKRRLL